MKQILGRLIILPAKHEVHKNSKISDIGKAKNRKQTETGGFASLFARVILITNINEKDRLINGQMGTVKYFEIKGKKVRTIYLELDGKSTGQIKRSGSDVIAKIVNGFQ